MPLDPTDVPWLESAFFENQQRFPPEQLLAYAGQYIALSWDGSRILEHARSEEELEGILRSRGIDPGRVVVHYIDEVEVNAPS